MARVVVPHAEAMVASHECVSARNPTYGLDMIKGVDAHEQTPREPEPFYWFLAGLVIGWTLAALGEQRTFSTGTMMGGLLGAITGLGIGMIRLHNWKSKIKLPPPSQPTRPSSDAR